MISRPRLAFVGAGALGAAALLTVACQKVPLLAPAGSTITLTATASALPTGGSTDVIAQVIEAAGTPPHEGTHVTFATNLGSFQPAAEIETDISGRAVVRFMAGPSSGTATITALSGGVSVAATNQVKIQIGAAAVGSVAISATPATLPNGGGTSTITATVADTSGNPLPNVPVTFAIDTTSNGTAGGSGTLSATVVNADANGRAVTTLTTARTTTVSATAGVATSSGTTTTAAQVGRTTITVNTTSSITVGSPSPASPTAGQTVTFPLTYGTSTTASPVIRVSVDWGDGRSQSYTGQPAAISHAFGGAGSYLIVVTGIDAIGDTSTTTTSITVTNRPQLVVTITPPTAGINAGVPAVFTIAATPTTGNTITSVSIDFGDGTGLVTLSGNVTSVPHTYATAGLYAVTVTATDSSGALGSASAGVVVQARAPVAVSVAATRDTASNTTVALINATATVTPTTATPARFDWSWGDGTSTTTTSNTTSHVYSASSVPAREARTITVTVTTTDGQAATNSTNIIPFP